MNQLISSAVGEKLAALMTEDYLARARRGNRKAYENVLRRVPDVAPEERDKLSNTYQAPVCQEADLLEGTAACSVLSSGRGFRFSCSDFVSECWYGES